MIAMAGHVDRRMCEEVKQKRGYGGENRREAEAESRVVTRSELNSRGEHWRGQLSRPLEALPVAASEC